jgi:hypothetical protein
MATQQIPYVIESCDPQCCQVDQTREIDFSEESGFWNRASDTQDDDVKSESETDDSRIDWKQSLWVSRNDGDWGEKLCWAIDEGITLIKRNRLIESLNHWILFGRWNWEFSPGCIDDMSHWTRREIPILRKMDASRRAILAGASRSSRSSRTAFRNFENRMIGLPSPQSKRGLPRMDGELCFNLGSASKFPDNITESFFSLSRSDNSHFQRSEEQNLWSPRTLLPFIGRIEDRVLNSFFSPVGKGFHCKNISSSHLWIIAFFVQGFWVLSLYFERIQDTKSVSGCSRMHSLTDCILFWALNPRLWPLQWICDHYKK